MVSLSDLENGLRLFKKALGSKWGPRAWQAFFIIAVLTIVAGCLATIGGFGKGAYTEMKGWFSPQSNPAPTITIPPQPSGCIVSGGTNYGKIEQACK